MVAGLAGITKSYLSMLKLGQREFNAEAIRHLDTADRLAPTRIRNDPIARDLMRVLKRRRSHGCLCTF